MGYSSRCYELKHSDKLFIVHDKVHLPTAPQKLHLYE